MALFATTFLATATTIFGFLQGAAHDAPVRKALEQSIAFEIGKDYEKAIAAILPVAADHPNDYTLNVRLGWLYYLDQKYDDSERSYQAAIQAAPRSLEAKLGYFLPLLADAKYQAAEAVARQVVDADPSNYYGNIRLAVALRIDGKLSEAREIVDRNLVKYPTDAYFNAEAALLGSSGGSTTSNDPDIAAAITASLQAETALDYAKGIEALAPQLKAHPRNYALNLRSGWLHYLKGEYDKSERDYQQAARIAPKSIGSKLGVLLAMLAQEHYKNAEPLAEQIIRNDRGNYYANLRLAVSLRKLGKLAEADKVVRKMLVLYPANISFMTELGLIDQAQNKTDVAKGIFLDVLALDPTNAIAKQQLSGAESGNVKK
jgi:tetratricopeptide (TPR) repeat protein